MNNLRNWFTCLFKGHRYNFTEIALQRLTHCTCCGRELFKRSTHIPPRPAPSKSLRSSTLGQASLARGEGRAKEVLEEAELARTAAAAVKREAEANIIEAINCGRFATTTSHAIARQHKSLDRSAAVAAVQNSTAYPNTTSIDADFGDSAYLLFGGGGRP